MADGSWPIPVIRSASFCTGIGGWEVATETVGGFEHAFFSEIEPFPSAVLAHHWPTVSNFGDLTQMDCTWWRGRLDAVWGSCPCQAFSFAGRRRGMKDKRGALTLAFLDRVDEIDPTYVLYENVKGILSDKSNAFGCLLGALAGEDGPLVPPGGKWAHAGYVLGPKRTIAWRLFDAQHGGVPQRRERVFVVGSTRDGADPRDILFERGCVRRDIAPERVAGLQTGRVGIGAGGGLDGCRSFATADVADTLTALYGEQGGQDLGKPGMVAVSAALRGRVEGGTIELGDEVATAVRNGSAGGGSRALALIIEWADEIKARVRRLTPLECERLQGLPDNHTRIPWRRRHVLLCPDGPRYKAIGNGLAIPDVRWIAMRLQRFHALKLRELGRLAPRTPIISESAA
jgi:DNA (cytosine-5)-methyltransferase 1